MQPYRLVKFLHVISVWVLSWDWLVFVPFLIEDKLLLYLVSQVLLQFGTVSSPALQFLMLYFIIHCMHEYLGYLHVVFRQAIELACQLTFVKREDPRYVTVLEFFKLKQFGKVVDIHVTKLHSALEEVVAFF